MGKSRVIENDFIVNKFIKVNGYIGYIEVQTTVGVSQWTKVLGRPSLNPKRLGSKFDPPPWFFQNYVCSREVVKPCFLWLLILSL